MCAGDVGFPGNPSQGPYDVQIDMFGFGEGLFRVKLDQVSMDELGDV